MSRVHKKTARFRFYEELNDFLSAPLRKSEFTYRFSGAPSVKDAIEAIGIPHTEVDIIIVDGASVGFDYHLRDGDRIGVYPVFESLDVTPLVRLRPSPLRRVRFVADVHLGKLARLLRLLGFDTVYERTLGDREIIEISVCEKRIILTRDRGLLKNSAVQHGYCVRSERPIQQAREVYRRFELESGLKPFHRCLVCNGRLVSVAKEDVQDRLPKITAEHFGEFFRCDRCGKVYWKGSHFDRLKMSVQAIAD
jgi:hypothetical protein